jgi:bifunctional ADP-heptose synthase (sugar kinase/adenylyltransferase)
MLTTIQKKDISKIKIGIIGDAIIDAYQFIEPIGKSSKSPTITANLLDCEYHCGGVLAIANHISQLNNNITLLTCLGINKEVDSENFIIKNIASNIKFEYIKSTHNPTILKKRFVDHTFQSNKLLEVIENKKSEYNEEEIKNVIHKIDDIEKKCDLILIADFGHGLFESEIIINRINNLKKYTCLMVQTNSANFGFNLITKYKKCDYFCIDQREADLALSNKDDNYEKKILLIANKLNSEIGTITLGKRGCIVFKKGDNPIYCSSKVTNQNIKDTVGAGDAFFSIASLLAYLNLESIEIGNHGNSAGYLATQYLGNQNKIKL